MSKKKQDTTKITLWEITYREDIEDVIRELNPCDYAYIYHDKDKEVNGKLKKPHYHIWARWLTPVRNSMITRVLGLSPDYSVKTARSQIACITYLTHETEQAKKMGKYKYDRSGIHTNLEADEIERIFLSKNLKSDNISRILDIIHSYKHLDEQGVCKKEIFNMFIQDLLSEELLEEYNKYYNSIFRRLILNIIE